MINAKTTLAVGILFSLFTAKTNAQVYNYKKATYDWRDSVPEPIKVNEEFKNEDAVILKEETTISLKGGAVTKYLRIKFLNKQGIARHKIITVPESFDHSFDNAYVHFDKRENATYPKLSPGNLEFFSARIIKPNGSIVPASYRDSLEKEEFTQNTIERTFFAYHFILSNLEVNDEVEIRYSYRTPTEYYYRTDTSSIAAHLNTYGNIADKDLTRSVISDAYHRVFFHGKLAKQDYRLNVSYSTRDLYFFYSHKGAQISDSLKNNKIIQYTWKATNLKPGINETGSREYNDLPYIQFYFHNRDYGIRDISNPTGFRLFTPYSWQYKLYPMVNFKLREVQYKHEFSSKDRHTLALNHFFDAQATNDTAPEIRFSKIHTLLADTFNYDPVKNFYNGTEPNLRNIEFCMTNKVIRRNAASFIYYQLAARLKTDFYLSPMHDARIEKIDINNYTPYVAMDQYISLKDKDDHSFFYSTKKHRFGLLANEMPFYFEDNSVFFVPQRWAIDDYHEYTQVDYIAGKTPSSNETDNKRNNNVSVNVALNTYKTSFDAKVDLKGQFSTMCRGAYQYNYTDTFCNAKYGNIISNIGADTKLIKKEMTRRDNIFPFASSFRVKYASNNIEKLKDSIFELNMSNWFGHITYDNFSAEKRQTGFYPDFKGVDVYRYNIKFDHNIQVLNVSDFEKEIKNALGTYKLVITQVQPDVIQIESYYLVNTEVVTAGKVKDVEDIYAVIAKLNKAKLKVKMLKA